MESIEVNRLKQEIRKLKEKYGVKGDYYPSKVEVLQELERRLENAELL